MYIILRSEWKRAKTWSGIPQLNEVERGESVWSSKKTLHENPMQIIAVQMLKNAKDMLDYQQTWHPTDTGINQGVNLEPLVSSTPLPHSLHYCQMIILKLQWIYLNSTPFHSLLSCFQSLSFVKSPSCTKSSHSLLAAPTYTILPTLLVSKGLWTKYSMISGKVAPH